MAVSIQNQVTDIVNRSMMDTCELMFGQNVLHHSSRSTHTSSPEKPVNACINMSQHGVLVNFCFSFDHRFLNIMALGVYPQDFLTDERVYEDIACEIVNIVCSKVKTFLNTTGYDIEMNLPFIPDATHACDCSDETTTHMSFFYNDNSVPDTLLRLQSHLGVAVDFLMQENHAH